MMVRYRSLSIVTWTPLSMDHVNVHVHVVLERLPMANVDQQSQERENSESLEVPHHPTPLRSLEHIGIG